MKTIKILSIIAGLGLVFAACSDTKDCKCDVDSAKKSANYKTVSTITMNDWDTDCSKITSEDLEDGQWLVNPCQEL